MVEGSYKKMTHVIAICIVKGASIIILGIHQFHNPIFMIRCFIQNHGNKCDWCHFNDIINLNFHKV